MLKEQNGKNCKICRYINDYNENIPEENTSIMDYIKDIDKI